MKEFSKTNKVTYNLMSFTGYKALLMFALLSEGPKSYPEISEYFYNHQYLKEKISIDTLRVYINSLRRLGFEIKRIRGEDKISKYVITKHPFELKIPDDQLKSVTKIYKNIVKNIEIKELLAMENFFEKIALYIQDEKFINDIRKISMLKDIDKKMLNELIDCCDRKDQIVISYNPPNSNERVLELIADKIEVTNGKIYLYGISLEHNQYSYFPISRIKQINEIKLHKTIPNNLKQIKVIYELKKNGEKFKPENNEKIIEEKEQSIIIEVNTSNEFLLKQRLLEFGPSCKILKPDKFKEDFINLLKDMKAGYYCG